MRRGLDLGLFYHPGFAEYQSYDPAQAARSLGPTNVGQYLLTNFATVDEICSPLSLPSVSSQSSNQHSALRLQCTSSSPTQVGKPSSSNF
jgi:penicillin V acylase-like amidase (Ntn superfamily)